MRDPDGRRGGRFLRPTAANAALPSPTHLLIADDHAIVVDSFEAYLTALREAIQVTTATSMPQALAIAEANGDLDLVLLDMHMPEMDGLTGLRHLQQRRPALPVAIMSGDSSGSLVRAVKDAGAIGFIPKAMSASMVLEAIRLMLTGARYFPDGLETAATPRAPNAPDLSPREHEVLAGLVNGRSNKEIARVLDVSAATVALHLTNIYRKLGVASRSQAIRRAFEAGLHQDRRRGG